MADQAQHLRDLVQMQRSRARVMAVTSGKGGVGKTSTSVNLAIALAHEGKRVVVFDADLGLANVEVLLGLNSLFNLQHVINGEKALPEILVQGPGGIYVVPGSSGLSQLADLGPKARDRVLDGLDELQNQADFIIVDTMAGIGQNAVAFAAAADEILVVTTPEPSAIVDAYAMIKTTSQTRDDSLFRMIVNMAVNEAQADAVARKLSRVAQQYLRRPLYYLGHIPRDPHVSYGVMQTQPFFLRFPNAPASKAIEELARRLVHQHIKLDQSRPGFIRRFAETLGLVSNA